MGARIIQAMNMYTNRKPVSFSVWLILPNIDLRKIIITPNAEITQVTAADMKRYERICASESLIVENNPKFSFKYNLKADSPQCVCTGGC